MKFLLHIRQININDGWAEAPAINTDFINTNIYMTNGELCTSWVFIRKIPVINTNVANTNPAWSDFFSPFFPIVLEMQHNNITNYNK